MFRGSGVAQVQVNSLVRFLIVSFPSPTNTTTPTTRPPERRQTRRFCPILICLMTDRAFRLVDALMASSVVVGTGKQTENLALCISTKSIIEGDLSVISPAESSCQKENECDFTIIISRFSQIQNQIDNNLPVKGVIYQSRNNNYGING